MTTLPPEHGAGVLAIVVAGPADEIDVLVRERPHQTLPFAGHFRLLDISMGNFALSGITHVWIVAEHHVEALAAAVDEGRAWGLDRRGEVRVIQITSPPTGTGTFGGGDYVRQISDQIRALNPRYVLMLRSAPVFSYDLSDLIEHHIASGQQATLATTLVPPGEAEHQFAVATDDEGIVTSAELRPASTAERQVAAGFILIDTEVLLSSIAEVVEAAGDEPLGSVTRQLLPLLVQRRIVRGHPMTGYWNDSSRPITYLEAHRHLLDRPEAIFRPDWPLVAAGQPSRPPRVHTRARVEEAMLSDACEIHGTVRRSVLGRGVIVEPGANVTDSVIMAGTIVRSGAQVRWSIVDEDCSIGRNSRVGAAPKKLPPRSYDVTVIGRGVLIPDGTRIVRGTHVEPRTIVERPYDEHDLD